MDKYLYEEIRLSMIKRAKFLGIASLACAIVFATIPFISMGLGFFAILFAILSKGYKPKLEKDSKFGLCLGIIGIVISLSITGSVVYKLYSDKEYRNSIYTIMDQFYGDTYKEEFGATPSEVMEKLFTGGEVND